MRRKLSKRELKRRKREQDRRYRQANKAKLAAGKRKWYTDNRELCLKRAAKWRKKHKRKYRKYLREYYKENKADRLAYVKEWVACNRDRRRRNASRWARKKSKDPIHRLMQAVRSRTRRAIIDGGGLKCDSSMALLGCSASFLRKYIARLWLPGMSWDNVGEWHIDHKIPCAAFNLRIHAEQKKCFHYSNLQPLWAFDNLSKGAKYKCIDYRHQS